MKGKGELVDFMGGGGWGWGCSKNTIIATCLNDRGLEVNPQQPFLTFVSCLLVYQESKFSRSGLCSESDLSEPGGGDEQK